MIGGNAHENDGVDPPGPRCASSAVPMKALFTVF